MDKLIELVMRNPLILLIVGAWVVGMVANAVKAQKKARERREQAMGPSPVPTKEASTTPQAQKSPREVIAAMGSGQQKRLPERRQMPGAARSAQRTQATPPPVQAAGAELVPQARMTSRLRCVGSSASIRSREPPRNQRRLRHRRVPHRQRLRSSPSGSIRAACTFVPTSTPTSARRHKHDT